MSNAATTQILFAPSAARCTVALCSLAASAKCFSRPALKLQGCLTIVSSLSEAKPVAHFQELTLQGAARFHNSYQAVHLLQGVHAGISQHDRVHRNHAWRWLQAQAAEGTREITVPEAGDLQWALWVPGEPWGLRLNVTRFGYVQTAAYCSAVQLQPNGTGRCPRDWYSRLRGERHADPPPHCPHMFERHASPHP